MEGLIKLEFAIAAPALYYFHDYISNTGPHVYKGKTNILAFSPGLHCELSGIDGTVC